MITLSWWLVAPTNSTEYAGEVLRRWIEQGEWPMPEFTQVEDVDQRTARGSTVTRSLAPDPGLNNFPKGDSSHMQYVNERGRPEPPAAGDETDTLLGSLERQRATFAWKCGGLDAAGLRATVGASTMTLGGLLKHLALVEDYYFSVKLHGREFGPPWDTVDWDADADWEWHSAAEDTPEQLMTLWQDAVNRSRSAVAEALADGGLDQLIQAAWPDGRTPSLRRLLIDLIEEYARHVGHADLIRESVDGLVGEDPPE